MVGLKEEKTLRRFLLQLNYNNNIDKNCFNVKHDLFHIGRVEELFVIFFGVGMR